MEENATPLQEAIHNAEFAEGHAYGVYMIYAGILREAGMVEGAMKLEELANNEKEHLERWLVKQGIDLEPSAIMARVIQMALNDSHRMYTDMLKLVQQYELGGAAAWKLGFEGASVWAIMEEYTS